MASLAIAKEHFSNRVQPRRLRDEGAENALYKRSRAPHRVWRRVTPQDQQRGEPYPCCTTGISLLAHFGLGIGVYYMQILILAVIFGMGSLILIPSFLNYSSSSYGDDSNDPRIYASGSCPPSVTVNATIGCADGQEFCPSQYRENCILSKNVIVSDLFMSVILFICIFIAKLPENELLERLDEAVQTLQDYSVVVKNPPKDADNPDEWYEFFSKFGNVRLVTVLKENASLSDVLLMRLLESRKKLEVQQSKYLHVKHLSRNQTRRNSRILLLDAELEAMYKRQFDVIRVYVTFDLEDHQRVCLEEFEPPNIQLLCPQRGIAHKAIFREGVVLAVGESPEFDNIYWQNLEVDDMSRRLRWISTSLMTIALLVACYYLISWVHDDHLDQLPIVITIVDGALPYFFEFFTAYERAADEDYRQDSLLIKLFLGRLLITIIFPYIFTSWASILDTNSVTTFINTQLAACLISPLISVVDPYGVFKRYIMSPLLSETQIEMNEYWAGSEWSLAERYTNLAKVVFLALFYSLVTPLGLVIGAVAMLLVFTVDRYLLLRTWKPPKMLDATMALRVRHFFALAIAAHLYVSSRFVYSWPMDEVYVKSQADGNGYVRVNKFPPLNILEMEPQAWHSQGQAATIVAYKWVTVLVIGAAAYSVFGTFILAQLAEIFCNQQGESFGEVMGIQFITVPKIGCYCPVAERSGETFICADLSQVTAMEEFQPSVFAANNLADLVPPEIRAKVLSSVKWYSGFGKYKHADHLRKSFMELNIPPLSGAAPHSLLTNFALSNAGRVHPQATSSHNDEVVEDEESVLWSPNAPLHTFDSTLDMSLGIGTKVDVGAAVKDGEVQEQKKIGRRVKRNRSTSPAVTPTGKLAPIKLPKSQL